MEAIKSKYQNGKIYKIINDIDQLIYVGSTIQTLNSRFTDHKCVSKLCPERKLYQHFAKLGIEHFKIILIKNYPCAGKTELAIEEERYKIMLNAQLNMIRAHQTAEQKREQENKSKNLYYQNNRAKYNERLFCKICGKTYIRNNKTQHCRSTRHQKFINFNQSKNATDAKFKKCVQFDKNKKICKILSIFKHLKI
jgi:hypothetical protein